MQEKTTTVTPADRLHGFEEFARQLMQEWKVPGLAVAIVQGDTVFYAQGFGLRDAAQGLEVTPRTLFPIASCTKAFTTAAMGILADQGRLDWNAPVRTYVPEFKLYDQFAAERMTPRDLVIHDSGLPRHDLAWYNSSASRQEIFARLQYLEPTKDFRSFWQYQNMMYMAAGYLVERISGQSWEEFVQQNIFDRLEMRSSNFDITQTVQSSPDYSHPYREVKDEVKEVPFYAAQGAIGPAGAIVSSVEDMSKWMIMHLNKGSYHGEQMLSTGQIDLLHSPQMIIPETSQYEEIPYASYAFGWAVEPYRGHPMLVHSGGIDGFSTLTTLFPRQNTGIVVLSNLSGSPVPSILTYNAFERLLALKQVHWSERFMRQHLELKEAQQKGEQKSEAERISGTQPSHSLEAYAGDYANPGYGTASIRLAGDHLQFTFNNMTYPLTHYHYDIFDLNLERFEINVKLSFQVNVKGDIDTIIAPLEETAKDIVFKRVPDKRMTEKSFLEQFTGEYEVLSMIATVALKGDHALYITIPGQPDLELEPYRGTTFRPKGMSSQTIEFTLVDGKSTEAIITMPNGVFTAKRRNDG